nr:hypothetical protein L203_03954 [Cryptococcus depauperatus CBS 7841]
MVSERSREHRVLHMPQTWYSVMNNSNHSDPRSVPKGHHNAIRVAFLLFAYSPCNHSNVMTAFCTKQPPDKYFAWQDREAQQRRRDNLKAEAARRQAALAQQSATSSTAPEIFLYNPTTRSYANHPGWPP